MTPLNACGLLETPYNFFIDHLAPLCYFLKVPIVTAYPQTIFLYQRYYPGVDIQVKNWSVRYLLENYTSVLYPSIPKPSFSDIIEKEQKKDPSDAVWKKPLKLIHHFHGCSDKGYHSDWIKPDSHIKDVDLLLIYGDRFKKLLEDKKLLSVPKSYLSIGNYRYQYYLKHKSYLTNLAHKEIFSKFSKKQTTILYAPTWADHEHSSSFFDIYQTLFESLPDYYNLIVKLHPNMTLEREGYDPTSILNIIQTYQSKANVLILPFYPLVYPLIDRCDIYLGDHSSVGYDVLTFRKPMYFLNVTQRSKDDPGALLFQCGTVIERNDFSRLYEIIEKSLPDDKRLFSAIRSTIYDEAFGSDQSCKELLKDLKENVSAKLFEKSLVDN